MAIIVTSDWHLRPGDTIPNFARRLLALGHKNDLVLNGDILDFIPYGIKAWLTPQGERTVHEFTEMFPPKGHLVVGNHDPMRYWRMVLKYYKLDLKPVRYVRLSNRGALWHFEHGHTRTQWSFLRYLAPGVTEFMTEYFPHQWDWLMRRFGWMRSPQTHWRPFRPKEANPMNELIMAVHMAWMRYALQTGMNVCIGHTHTFAIYQWKRRDGLKSYLVDAGNLADGDAVQINLNVRGTRDIGNMLSDAVADILVGHVDAFDPTAQMERIDEIDQAKKGQRRSRQV